MMLIILLLIAGSLRAIEEDEQSPLLSQSYKYVKKLQYTTEISDNDTVECDLENPANFLMGTPEGLGYYDSEKHQYGRCKVLPAEIFYSVRCCKERNNNLLLFSTTSRIGVWNRTHNKVYALATTGKVPSRVRFLPYTAKAIAFCGNKIDVYDLPSVSRDSAQVIINPTAIKGLVTSQKGDEEFITWDAATMQLWDLRQSKPSQSCVPLTFAIHSVAPHGTKIAIGTLNGAMIVFDKRKLHEQLMVQRLTKEKAVTVEYTDEEANKLIIACGEHVMVIDKNPHTIPSTYTFPRGTDIEGFTLNKEESIAVSWEGICNQDALPVPKHIISIVDLKKAESKGRYGT